MILIADKDAVYSCEPVISVKFTTSCYRRISLSSAVDWKEKKPRRKSPTICFQIVAKGQVLVESSVPITGIAATITIPVTVQMAPRARLLVFYMRPDSDVVANVIDFEVAGLLQNNVSFFYFFYHLHILYFILQSLKSSRSGPCFNDAGKSHRLCRARRVCLDPRQNGAQLFRWHVSYGPKSVVTQIWKRYYWIWCTNNYGKSEKINVVFVIMLICSGQISCSVASARNWYAAANRLLRRRNSCVAGESVTIDATDTPDLTGRRISCATDTPDCASWRISCACKIIPLKIFRLLTMVIRNFWSSVMLGRCPFMRISR